MSNDINLPIAKAATAIATTTAANTGIPDAMAQAAAAGADYTTWIFVNSVPWDTLSQFLAVVIGAITLGEIIWKKLLRPFCERRGWIKPMRRRVITVEEYEAGDTGPAPL